jgi:hypothetical protein
MFKDRLIIGEYLGSSNPRLAYGRRWVFDAGLFAIRLHRWYKGRLGPQESMHSHAWWFLTFILQGGYTDATQPDSDGVAQSYEVVKAPAVRFRAAEHIHYVWPHKETGATTLVISGPPLKEVFYYACGKRWQQREWHDANADGKNPCDN